MRVYWNTRPKATTHNPHWRTPDQLWDEAVRYFDWAIATPLTEQRLLTTGNKVHKVDLEKTRAFTINGLCAFLGVNPAAFTAYSEKEEFAHVTDAIRNVIHTQKFEGAAAGLLNAALIARDLGLADRQELTGKNGGPIQSEDTTKRDADEFASRMLRLAAARSAGGGDGEAERGSEG